MPDLEVSTCSTSVLKPGVCCCRCNHGCLAPATVAVLDDQLVEHAMCQPCVDHVQDTPIIATKPLQWDPLWGPRP